jgi:hypothetical protein
MIFPRSKRTLSQEELDTFREHWEWSGSYAITWIVITVALLGGVRSLRSLIW